MWGLASLAVAADCPHTPQTTRTVQNGLVGRRADVSKPHLECCLELLYVDVSGAVKVHQVEPLCGQQGRGGSMVPEPSRSTRWNHSLTNREGEAAGFRSRHVRSPRSDHSVTNSVCVCVGGSDTGVSGSAEGAGRRGREGKRRPWWKQDQKSGDTITRRCRPCRCGEWHLPVTRARVSWFTGWGSCRPRASLHRRQPPCNVII